MTTERETGPLTAEELRKWVRETVGAAYHDPNPHHTFEECGDPFCTEAYVRMEQVFAAIDAERAARAPEGEAFALDVERSTIPHSLVEQVIDATIGLSGAARAEPGLREALDAFVGRNVRRMDPDLPPVMADDEEVVLYGTAGEFRAFRRAALEAHGEPQPGERT